MSMVQSVTANQTWDKVLKGAQEVASALSPAAKVISGAAKLIASTPEGIETAKNVGRCCKLFVAIKNLGEIIPRQLRQNVNACGGAIDANKSAILSDLKELRAALDQFQKTPLARSGKDLAQLGLSAGVSVQSLTTAIESASIPGGQLVAVAEGFIAFSALAKAGEAKANLLADLPELMKDAGPSLRSLERLVEAMRNLALHTAPVAAECTPDFRPNPDR